MDYLSCGDVAQRLGITTRRVQQMCKQGDFQGAEKIEDCGEFQHMPFLKI